MVRGAFYAQSVRNLLSPTAPVGNTMHIPSQELMPLWEAAQRYQAAGDSVVLIAGHRFGTGSSRDWAAKVQSILGVRAVLALSFERIHRTNLIGMGILPLKLPATIETIEQLAICPGDKIVIHAQDEQLQPRSKVLIQIKRATHNSRDAKDDDYFWAQADVQTELEIELLRCGGAMPYILKLVRDKVML